MEEVEHAPFLVEYGLRHQTGEEVVEAGALLRAAHIGEHLMLLAEASSRYKEYKRTFPVNLAGHMVYVGDNGELAGGAELPEGMFVGDIVALVGGFFVFVGVFGHDAHQQLVQRVLDAFPIEGRHYDASMLEILLGTLSCLVFSKCGGRGVWPVRPPSPTSGEHHLR